MHQLRLALICAFTAIIFISAEAFGGADFFTVPVFPVGTAPTSIATGDFNRDGITDVVTAGVSSLSILLGNKNGAFQAPVNYSITSTAKEVSVGDFNGDGVQDIAVLYSDGPIGMDLLLGNPDGTFQAPHSIYFPGMLRTGMVMGDFKGDGHLDVAVSNATGRSVSVLLGKGNGTFQLEVNYSTGLRDKPDSLAVGDVNGDGKLDLVAGSTVAKIFLGNGDGTFQNEVDGPNVGFVVFLADLNKDGKLDLLANAGPTLNVAIGNGDGTFQAVASYANPGFATIQSVSVFDVNGDGIPDVAVDDGNSQGIALLLGNGDGTLRPPVLYLVGTGNVALVASNFGNGHKPGIVVTDGLPGVDLAIANPNGTLQAPRITLADAFWGDAGDLNGDGKMDVVTGAGTRLDVYYGNGDTSFQPPIETILNISIEWVAVGDLNGDGKPDVVAAGTLGSGAVVSVLLNNGDGTLGTPVNYNLGTDVIEIALGDLNGDHKLDIAAVSFRDSTISVLLNNGDGTFQPAIVTPAAFGSQSLTLADFNGDGKLDAAVQGSTQVTVLFGKGDGTFSSSKNYTVGVQPNKVRSGDFNGDGKPDLAFADAGGQVLIMLNNGDGTFANPTRILGVSSPRAITIGDFNGDGKQDIVAGSFGFSTLNGNGNGIFHVVDKVATCDDTVLLTADFNSDGRPDLLAVCEFQLEVLPNAAGPH